MQQITIGCLAEEEPILIGRPLDMLLPNMAALRHQLWRDAATGAYPEATVLVPTLVS